MSDRAVHVTVTDGGRLVRATYHGGAYIDLRFGTATQPSEVINVWDHHAGRPAIPCTRGAVRAAVADWIASNDDEWPDWYPAYLENLEPA